MAGPSAGDPPALARSAGAELAAGPRPGAFFHRAGSPVRCAALFLALLLPGVLTAAEAPRAAITRTIEQVLTALADADLSEADRGARVKALIAERLDEQGIARRVLATNWHGATVTQRRRFSQSFVDLVVETYWQRMRNYRDETVRIIDSTPHGDRLATVSTVVVTPRADIPVDYKLNRNKRGEWLVYDVAIERVSLVRNYRTSFQQMVQRHGLDYVINELKRKLADIRRDGDPA